MRVAFVVLLSALAVANASLSFRNQIVGDSLYDLGNLELYVKSVAPEDSFEDQLAAQYNSLDVEGRNILADAIKNALEDFRDVVINGNDDIPPLDPFVVDHIGPFIYTNVGVRGTANVRNFRVEGLRWYVVDRVTFNPVRLSFGLQITIPRIDVTGSYDARATVAILNHSAGGNFRVFLNRLIVSVDARLGTNVLAGHLILRQLDIKIDIHDTFIQINGMFGSSLINNFISSLVQNITQDVIQSEMENVSQMLSEQLFDVVNDFLRDYTINDILG